jgi:Putative zinc finger motif, C2HC5-type
MTSDLLPKPKVKAAPSAMAAAIHENRPMTELEEIDSAIQSLSQPTRPKRFHCGCFGTKHEVYPLAPNCLHCGRVTCLAEGMGPCFFCGEELVSEALREDVVRELRHERGVAKTRAANEKVRKVRTGERLQRVWASKVGGQEFVVPSAPMTPSLSRESGQSGRSTPDSALLEAERKRDELLEFDRTFAERTKIIGTCPRKVVGANGKINNRSLHHMQRSMIPFRRHRNEPQRSVDYNRWRPKPRPLNARNARESSTLIFPVAKLPSGVLRRRISLNSLQRTWRNGGW